MNYQEAFIANARAILGNDYDSFIQSLSEPSPTSIRINPYKKTSKFDSEESVSWCLNAHYLAERPSFTFDPLFHAGTYYVQEASSMFLEQVWKQINPQNNNVRVLDMCAAPGGKSTHLASLINGNSLLVSNELISNRNNSLQQNIVKWGMPNCIVTQNDPKDFALLNSYFDIILVDAPCSGEGLFRKDKNAINEWSEKNVSICSARQKDILKQAVDCLKPGGFLVYSTCTFQQVENDANMELAEELNCSNFKLENNNPAITATKFGLQFFPHKAKGEGFYIAVLKKNGLADAENYQVKNIKLPIKKSPYTPLITSYLTHEKFVIHEKNEFIFAIPEFMYPDFIFLEKQLYIRHAGIYMGTTKGKDFLPSHDLALSICVNPNLASEELNYDQAIAYLRCETPKIISEKRGWCIAQYQGHNLGWMKLLPGRINNYFPKELRILKQL